MYEAFFQVQKKYALENSLGFEKKDGPDFESLAGKNERDKEHLRKYELLKRSQEEKSWEF